jgi:hypothetical protein
MAETTCENCVYFRSAQVLGTCRRFPSPVNKHQSDWCGEHQIKMLALPVYDILTDTTSQAPAPKKPGRKPKDGSQSAA